MKNAFMLLGCLVFSANLCAQDMPDKALAIEYLQASRFEQVTKSTIDSYSQSLVTGASQEQQDNIRRLLNGVMGWEAQKDQLAEVVMRVYTRQELDAAIAYLRSPLGASMAGKVDEFSKLYAAQMAVNFQKFMREHTPAPSPAPKPDPAR